MSGVLFINPWDRLIGPNRYLVEILKHASELARGATVVFHEENDARGEYEALGCRVEVWPETAPLRAKPTAVDAWGLVRRQVAGLGRMAGRLRRLAPDIVVSNSELVWIGGWAARITGIEHLQVFHAITFQDRLGTRPWLLRTFVGLFSLWNERLIAVSDTLRRALVKGGLSCQRVVVVPNPIDVHGLAVASREALPSDIGRRLEGRRPLIVSAGRISPMKGQDLLVQAMGAVVARHPDALFAIAGRVGSPDGFEDTMGFMKGIESQVSAAGLKRNAWFMGEVECLPALLADADLYVQPSRTESFGRVAAEALVCGTPVVGFDVGALRETVGPGALLVRKGDSSALAEAVVGLLAEPERMRRMAREGAAHVKGLYEARAVAKRFSGLLSGELRLGTCAA